MQRSHNPYGVQVVAPESFVVFLFDGVRLVNCDIPTKGNDVVVHIPEHAQNVVCYVPPAFAPTTRISVRFGNNEFLGRLEKKFGILAGRIPTGCDCLHLTEDDNATDKAVLETIIQAFHDEKVNPSFGALPLEEIERLVCCKHGAEIDVEYVLAAHDTICHTYEGKDGKVWVVLRSHCKKVTVTEEKCGSYAKLLRFLCSELSTREIPLGDLFRRVSHEPEFCTLLASNFTILKKFLVKNNHQFVWFQDEASKTTKVRLQWKEEE